jgi:glycosyltransferase involved in cell wall biosynthesis
MPKPNLSVCLLALNEEKKIGQALESVKNLGDELIVCVDDNSKDKTEQIAKKFTKNVYLVAHKPALEWQLKEMFSRCQSEWIFRLDADEVVSPDLKTEILDILQSPQANGYSIPRKNIIFGKWIAHTGWYPDPQLRLVKKLAIKSTSVELHQTLPVEDPLGTIQSPLIHYNYETVDQFLDKLLRYTTIEAQTLFSKEQMVKPADLITKPVAEFIKRFVAQEGYKDGVHGLSLSILQSFYEFLVVVKLWEAHKFKPDTTVSIDEVKEVIGKNIQDWKWWQHEQALKSADPFKKQLIKAQRKLGL